MSTAKATKATNDAVGSGTAAKRKTTKKPRSPSGRAAAPAPVGPRRAVFVDVENTTGEAQLMRVLESLAIDRTVQPTELTAVGNWRTMGQRIARRLAALGAHLVHSAPVTGVRDWSDLWIATAAGCWLGRAAPGDKLEIISDDRAFDAVGDVAANLGVQFRRVGHRSAVPAAEAAEAPAARKRRSGRRRRGGRQADDAPKAVVTPAPVVASDDEAQAAPLDSIHAVMESLSGGRPGGWVNLDVLEGALKERGFRRPPGSPRLVTRLRKSKDFEVSTHGTVRLAGTGR